MFKSTRSHRRMLMALAGAGAVAIALTACSSSNTTGSTSANAPKSFSFLAINENTTIPSVLTELSKNECKAENKALPLKISKEPQANLDQQLTLLAGQKALPVAFVSPGAPALTEKLYKSNDIINFDKSATTAAADIVPAADSSVKALYNGQTIVLPTELNIEGIWYNKAILAKHNIAVPATWNQLVAAFNALKADGVQPISNAGDGGDGWGITRWVGAYIFRELGPDAMTKVADGSAKLTDPNYVKAADAIGALGKAGDFGPSPQSVSYATALNTFLTGGAGFIYMGSWAVSDFNSASEDKIGSTNIGFIPFPSVSGGKGSASQTPANVGTTISVSASAYNSSPKVQNWVNCISANYGTVALKNYGQVTGLKVASGLSVSRLTKLVQTQIKDTKTSVQWFEALFSAGATTTSQDNGGLLGSGQSTGEQFMTTVSAALASGN